MSRYAWLGYVCIILLGWHLRPDVHAYRALLLCLTMEANGAGAGRALVVTGMATGILIAGGMDPPGVPRRTTLTGDLP